jgi:hypothetical protein
MQSNSNGNSSSNIGFVPPGSNLLAHNSSAPAAAAAHYTGSNGSVSGGARPALTRPDVLQHFSSHPDVEAALEQVLQYGQRLLLLRANDWSSLDAEGGTGEGAACRRRQQLNLVATHEVCCWAARGTRDSITCRRCP